MPGKILGLDIKDDFVAAIQVASTLKGYQITASTRVSIEGENGLENALKEIFDQADLKSDVCHSSIPAERISYRNLRLPFKDPKKIRQPLPFEIETMVPFHIEDLLVDFSVIDRSDQTASDKKAPQRYVVLAIFRRREGNDEKALFPDIHRHRPAIRLRRDRPTVSVSSI